jgi:glutaminyl-tRNA synthetase
MDVKNDNYNMFDLIAYRVKFAQHPRAGATWYMFPPDVDCRC